MMGSIETRLLENPDKSEGQGSLDWKYIAKTSSDVRNVVLNDPDRVPSVCALDKVYAAGEGEDMREWYGLRERTEGCLAVSSQAVHAAHEVGSTSSAGDKERSADGLMGFPVIEIALGKTAYIQEQIRPGVPDFVKAGISIDKLLEKSLRRYMVLRTSRSGVYEKLRLDATEIDSAKIMTVNPVPMEMDVLRFKGKGKRKYKDLNKERGNESKSSDPNDVCYGKKNRKKSDGLQCEVDLDKAKCRNCFTNMLLGILNGKFKGDTQKDIQSWKSGIWNSWDLSVAPMCDKCCMKGITLDSGATVNVCPGEYGMQSGWHIELQAVDVSLVENHGSRDMRYKVRDCMFMGRRGEKDLIYAFHVIDMEFLERTVIRTDKGSTDGGLYGILEPLGEISRKRIVICNDNEPVVKKLDQAVALHREDDMVVKESSQSIGCNEHNHFLSVA